MSEHMHNRIAQIETVSFPGGALQIILEQAGPPWMLLRPACNELRLSFLRQRKQLERAPWAVTCVMKAQGARGKQHYWYCLRGDRLSMWLATISSECVRPELRERLTLWQCEATDALARWAVGHAQAQPPPLAPSDPPLPLLAELRQMIAQEVRSALQQQLASQSPPTPPVSTPLRFGILLPSPDTEGWKLLALGVKQCCTLVESDCLTSARMAQLLAYEADAVPALLGAVDKLTGRRSLSGRQLGYLLSCAQKRGLVAHDGRLHSYGGYGWRAVDRTSTISKRKGRAGSAHAWLLPAVEAKAARGGGT